VRRLTLLTRLVLLTGLLLGTLAVSNFLSNRALSSNADTLAAEAAWVSSLTDAGDAASAFGDLKYWLTDLAVSLLMRSETNAELARIELDDALTRLEPRDAATVAQVRAELDTMVALSLQAVDAYTDQQRVLGNSLTAKARTHIGSIDARLDALVDRLETQALEQGRQAVATGERAVALSGGMLIGATALGLLLTAWVLQSIRRPLRALDVAMNALTRGELDAPLPEPADDEPGRMVRTLGLFRDSLLERDRLRSPGRTPLTHPVLSRPAWPRAAGASCAVISVPWRALRCGSHRPARHRRHRPKPGAPALRESRCDGCSWWRA